jgi:hypothetical protein
MQRKSWSGEACVRLVKITMIATLVLAVVGATMFSRYAKYRAEQQAHSKLQVRDPLFDLFNR